MAAPAARASKGKPAARRRRVSLGVKFTFFVLLTIGLMMSMTTWLSYRQQQWALRDQVLQRGATIARGLASVATESNMEDLPCTMIAVQAMPKHGIEAMAPITFSGLVSSLMHDLLQGQSQAPETLDPNSGVVEVEIVDTRKNTIAGHSNTSLLGQPFELPKGLQPYRDEPILVQPYRSAKGDQWFDIAVPCKVVISSGADRQIGIVHLRMTQRLVDIVVKRATLKLLLVTAVMMIIGLIAALVLSRYLTKPIHELVVGVLAIAGGDLNQELDSRRTDELGELTAAFNEMAASLREKELIKGAFSTYVSSQVMEQILKDPSQLALGGARKRATMLFSDIRGFTSMSESMQPEEVVSIINVYLSLQTEIVLRNEGMLDKFVGDCVMAVYGLPWAKPDDALRAVRTAVEIQAAIRRLNEARAKEGQKTITIGIGINSGDVVAGNMGSQQKMDYTVIGDSVNLAARLEANAEGGTILISETTYEEVKDHVVAEKLAPIPVKGKKEKVPIYSVQGMKA